MFEFLCIAQGIFLPNPALLSPLPTSFSSLKTPTIEQSRCIIVMTTTMHLKYLNTYSSSQLNMILLSASFDIARVLITKGL